MIISFSHHNLISNVDIFAEYIELHKIKVFKVHKNIQVQKMSFIGFVRFREIVFYWIIWKVILSWHKTVTYPPIFLLQTKIDYYYLVAAPAALSSRVADLNCFENCLPFISFQALRMWYAKKVSILCQLLMFILNRRWQRGVLLMSMRSVQSWTR